jgi:predicted ATPase
MLKNIKIENFRAFSEEINIRIRPITVLIGANSAGKSTLIKFLLMLQQTLETSEDAFLVTEGRHVHMGTFQNLKNSTYNGRTLRFEIELETNDLPPESIRNVRNQLKKSKLISHPGGNRSELRIGIENRSNSFQKDQAALFHLSASLTYGKLPNRGVHLVSAEMNGEKFFKAESKNLRRTGFLSFATASDDPKELINASFDDLFLQGIRYEIRAMQHLSPIREESERAIILASPPPNDVGHMGEFAMPHLQRIMTENSTNAAFIKKHIEAVADIEDLKFESSMKGYISQCRARNKKTGADAYLADFGFGVSQCIPIFVQGAMLHKGQLLIVEQPEAQLHPTAQLEMGSFFAELWKEREIPSLIETHSENIILRLRLLISKGYLKPEDVSIAYFHSEDKVVRVKNLDINSDGSFEKGLPMEFFGKDLLEALQIGI